METSPTPFVKWLGGKRRVLKELRPFYPQNYNQYYEPFVGGGSVFYDVSPQEAVISDSNGELINVYETIRNDTKELIEILREHAHLNTKDYYMHIRALDRDSNVFSQLSDIDRAARFIYLNKTGFNGLHRVNQKGQNNVPYGKYDKPNIIDEKNLNNLHAWLNNRDVTFLHGSYEDVFTRHEPQPGSFVYLDPPYIPLTLTSSFVGYDKNGFTLNDHKTLSEWFNKLDEAGVNMMLSNSDTDITRNLYATHQIESISVLRSVGSTTESRGKIGEVIVIGKTLSKNLKQ